MGLVTQSRADPVYCWSHNAGLEHLDISLCVARSVRRGGHLPCPLNSEVQSPTVLHHSTAILRARSIVFCILISQSKCCMQPTSTLLWCQRQVNNIQIQTPPFEILHAYGPGGSRLMRPLDLWLGTTLSIVLLPMNLLGHTVVDEANATI